MVHLTLQALRTGRVFPTQQTKAGALGSGPTLSLPAPYLQASVSPRRPRSRGELGLFVGSFEATLDGIRPQYERAEQGRRLRRVDALEANAHRTEPDRVAVGERDRLRMVGGRQRAAADGVHEQAARRGWWRDVLWTELPLISGGAPPPIWTRSSKRKTRRAGCRAADQIRLCHQFQDQPANSNPLKPAPPKSYISKEYDSGNMSMWQRHRAKMNDQARTNNTSRAPRAHRVIPPRRRSWRKIAAELVKMGEALAATGAPRPLRSTL